MKKYILNIILVPALVFCISHIAFAQSIRSSVNKGVGLYDKQKYVDSEVEFKKGLEKSPDNFQANFNLGDSYYKEGKYEEALRSYQSALAKAENNKLKAEVYHNIGNSLLKDKKIKESIGAYADALKLNPSDEATKYNLSYALNLLKNNNQKNKNNKNDKKNKNDKNKQNNKNDHNQNQNKNNKDQKQNQQNQNQNDQQKQQQQNQQNQPQQNKISKAQAEAIFNALNNDEKDLQKQLRKMKGQPIKTGKDW